MDPGVAREAVVGRPIKYYVYSVHFVSLEVTFARYLCCIASVALVVCELRAALQSLRTAAGRRDL